MYKLKEILHRLHQQAEDEGLTPLDNWKITDYDFMTDMEFKPDGEYTFSLKTPNIKVYHKQGEGFVVDDKARHHKEAFPTFHELTEYFTKYEQKWEHEPYKS